MTTGSVRRTARRQAAPTVYTCGDVEVDCGARVARVAGQRQLLTFSEFEALQRLVEGGGRVLTRAELHQDGVRQEEASRRAVDTLITRLRNKLRHAQSFRIETVQRVGYRCYWSPSSGEMLGQGGTRRTPR